MATTARRRSDDPARHAPKEPDRPGTCPAVRPASARPPGPRWRFVRRADADTAGCRHCVGTARRLMSGPDAREAAIASSGPNDDVSSAQQPVVPQRRDRLRQTRNPAGRSRSAGRRRSGRADRPASPTVDREVSVVDHHRCAVGLRAAIPGRSRSEPPGATSAMSTSGPKAPNGTELWLTWSPRSTAGLSREAPRISLQPVSSFPRRQGPHRTTPGGAAECSRRAGGAPVVQGIRHSRDFMRLTVHRIGGCGFEGCRFEATVRFHLCGTIRRFGNS